MPASKTTAIPTINNIAQLQQAMQNWKSSLSRTIRIAVAPPPPFNFRATQARGGIQLNWGIATPIPKQSKVLGQATHPSGPDGYEILISKNGSFKDDLQVVSLNDITQTSYFHSIGGGPTKFYFKIHATAGTQSSPQSTFGPDSGTIFHVSLDPNDTTTKPTTNRDFTTSDLVRATARGGRYPNQYLRNY